MYSNTLMTSLNSRANISSRSLQNTHTHTTSGVKSFRSTAVRQPDPTDVESAGPIEIHISHVTESDRQAGISKDKLPRVSPSGRQYLCCSGTYASSLHRIGSRMILRCKMLSLPPRPQPRTV